MVPAASSSLAATFYLPLRARASAELEREYFARAAAAESAREEETAAATVLAASWRGKAWRDQLLSLHAWALIIARCSRGFLHRQRARLELRQRSLQWQRLVFDACASVVQKHFRAFNSRKHRHDFYARKAYLASVVQKGEEAVRSAAEQLQQETEKRRLAEDEKARAQVDYLACKLHHLRSTETVPSIYASPYHEGFHPTAFGVPVEQRLRETIKPTLRAEIRAKQRSAPPLASLPPIAPLLRPQVTPAEINALKQQEIWLSKASRMGQSDFVRQVGGRRLPQLGSVHTTPALEGAEARQVRNFERPITKARWMTTEPFYLSVPSDKVVPTTGQWVKVKSKLQAAAKLAASSTALKSRVDADSRLAATALFGALPSPPRVLAD